MGRIVEWFIHNSVAANLLMVLIIIGGVTTFPALDKQFFPERKLNQITINVVYPGAGPTEVEQQICIRIEEALGDVDGIDELRSVASEGLGTVTIDVDSSFDSLRVLNDVKSKIDGITTFPAEAERPTISERLWKSRMISIGLAGDIGEANLKELGEQIREELVELPNVQVVELRSPRAYEMSIEVSELDLRRFGITFQQVANAVKGSSLNLPAGKLRTENGDISIQTRAQAYEASEFENIVLQSDFDGSSLTVGDIATVTDGFEEVDVVSFFNGKPSLALDVYVTTKPNVLRTSAEVYSYVESVKPRLPAGVELVVWNDMSIGFKDRLSTLANNGLSGLLLVFIVLLLFLRPLLAFWVSVGIGVAFLGAIWLLPMTDTSLNMVSLFAFILILGILVDDAIIVAESIYTYQNKGHGGIKGAILGTQVVIKPVWFAVLTTMVVFGLFYFLPEEQTESVQIANVVMAALMFSLIESMLILPVHLAHMKPEQPGKYAILKPLEKLREKLAYYMEALTYKYYKPILIKCINNGRFTLAAFFLVFMIPATYFSAGWLPLSFFPTVPGDYLSATVVMQEGTPFADLEDVREKLETQAYKLQQEVNIDDEAILITNIQSQAYGTQVRVTVQTENVVERGIPLGELQQRWIKLVGPIPLAKDFDVRYTIGNWGKDIELQVAADEVDSLNKLTAELRQELAGFAGVYNMRDSLDTPRPEIELRLKPLAEVLNITSADLARQVRRAFYGEEVQRIPRLREDVKVMVRYPESERSGIEQMMNMRVRAPDGIEIPFESVAEVTFVDSYTRIDRTDRQRVAKVSADTQAGFSAGEIIRSVLTKNKAEWSRKYPDASVKMYGEQEQSQEFRQAMTRLLGIGMVIIFALMAIVFKSYWQPILIVSAIPYGMVGAIFGHVFLGINLSMFSLLGIVACAGVVVNDNLVLIDRVNQLRDQGFELREALINGATDRFRAIVLTSVTTFVGLVPIMMETSIQAQFLIPMVASLAFGVLFASFVTLMMVPALYLVGERYKLKLESIIDRGKREIIGLLGVK
ncbi:MAG: multidrug efflux pump subunit AcrB [Pseudomonadales bacterium]